MTSRFRLLIASATACLALILGWFTNTSRQDAPPESRRNGLVVPQLAAADDIDRYVRAVFASELFPDAALRQDENELSGADGMQTADQFEQSLRDPSLSAFVKREDAWMIILYGVGEGAQTREVGDQLADGWIIQNIDSTSVLLTNGEDSRRIEVFKAEPDTQ